MLLALHMTHSRMAPVKEKVKNSPRTSMWVTCLWSGQTFGRASQAADTYAGAWGILNFFLHSTPIHFFFFFHRWHLGCDVAFQCPWSWLDACRRPNGTVLQLWIDCLLREEADWDNPVSFFFHRGFPATSLQKFMDLSHSSILQAYDIMYFSGAQSHFNQWARNQWNPLISLVSGLINPACHISINEPTEPEPETHSLWHFTSVGVEMWQAVCLGFWLGGLIDWNVTAGFPRFLALLRCFCQQLTWSDTSEPFETWDTQPVFRVLVLKCPPNWAEVSNDMMRHCFEWHVFNDMMDSVLSKLRLVSTLNHTWSLWLQRAWLVPMIWWTLYCPNWGWFLLWIILEVFDYRGHDGTADSSPENDSSAFAATPSIDKWWWRQHWWLVSDWIGLHQDAINRMAIALADICHLTFWTGWNLFSQWFQYHLKRLEKKATQRTLLPLVPHYQMKHLSSLLIKDQRFPFYEWDHESNWIKDNLYAHTAPIHSLQTCFQPGDGGSSFAGPDQGRVTKGVLAWSINAISHQPNI